MLAEQQTEHKVTDRRWTFSNALSALRMVLVIPAAIALGNGMSGLAIGLFVLAAVTDVLDGYLARRLDEVSEFGKIIDPLADKVFVGVIVVQMLVMGLLPLWFVAAVLARDILILLGGIYYERRTGVVLPSNYPGKIAVVILSTTLLLIVAGVTGLTIEIFYAASLLLMAISLTLYATRAVQLLRK
jgi:CDP-diacylglycerol--glycerol-3-phosphate 3-phosphatidyltransferase